jgi:hypothetical protein
MNDLPPNVHSQLDVEVKPIVSLLPFDSQAASIFFIVLGGCAEAYDQICWPFDQNRISMKACKDLLASNEEIRELLRDAHSRGQYAEIRNLGRVRMSRQSCPFD